MNKNYRSIDLTTDNCIKCNICTTACPVMKVTDLFIGPKYSGPQANRFRNIEDRLQEMSVDYCTGCRICNMVCPSNVNITELNTKARAKLVDQGSFPFRIRLRNNMIARAEKLGQIAQPFHPFTNFFLRNKPTRLIIEKILGISKEAPLPNFSPYKFTTWFRKHKTPNNTSRKVVYFHGCSTQYYEPRIGEAAVFVLEKNGFEVIVPQQNCCGLPLLSNGEFHSARKYHKNNVSKLIEWVDKGYSIVGTSTSCTLTLKEEAPKLLDMTDRETLKIAENTYDINEFLLLLLSEDTLNLDFQSISFEIPYHIPCQYRAHLLGKPGIDILHLIPDLKIIDTEADCCGIAGTYGYKKEKNQISSAIGNPLFEKINKLNPSLIICDSETCRWQITHNTNIPAFHPVEILAVSYGYRTGQLFEKLKLISK